MIENLVGQFMGSSGFGHAVESLEKKFGMKHELAHGAVQATAEGAALELGKGGLGGIVGKITGGVAGMLGGGPGMPPGLVDKVVHVVTTKTGLDAIQAKNVVDLVLPKVIEFAKGMPGGKLFG